MGMDDGVQVTELAHPTQLPGAVDVCTLGYSSLRGRKDQREHTAAIPCYSAVGRSGSAELPPLNPPKVGPRFVHGGGCPLLWLLAVVGNRNAMGNSMHQGAIKRILVSKAHAALGKHFLLAPWSGSGLAMRRGCHDVSFK